MAEVSSVKRSATLPLQTSLPPSVSRQVPPRVEALQGAAERAHRIRRNGHYVGILVDLPNRRSFSPDAAFHRGPLSGKFLEGAPRFAAEVRSDGDYGPIAERAMADKRADYVAAETRPTTYRRGERAEAEPALPGWSMPVGDLPA